MSDSDLSDSFESDFTRSSSSDGDAPDAVDDDDNVVRFRLLDLPDELKIAIVGFVDERDPSPTFPSGPSDDLLALTATCRWFRTVCRPLVWRSVWFARNGIQYRHRNLRALYAILQDADLPIVALSAAGMAHDYIEEYDPENPDAPLTDESALAKIIQHLARSTLQVLFLADLLLDYDYSIIIFRAIATSPRLSTVRLDDIHWLTDQEAICSELGPLRHIKTLQIISSEPELSELVAKCPNLDSLLLWPELWPVDQQMTAITGLLPHLRHLSLDFLQEARAFRVIADEITRLADVGIQLPLEELFLRGFNITADFAALSHAIERLPALRRFAVCRMQQPTPTFVAELAKAAPQLEELSLIVGGYTEANLWSASLDDYLIQLSKFPRLRFFAWDRLSPRGPDEQDRRTVRQSHVEYATLSRLGSTCKTLKEAVCITGDVRPGIAFPRDKLTGYFATYTKEEGTMRITVEEKTVEDFLIPYDRWVKVE